MSMEINLIRLYSPLLVASTTLKEDDDYINELNDTLFDNDCVIKENVMNPLINVLFIESRGIDKKFKEIEPLLFNPLIILVGKHYTALKAALEVNSYLTLHNKEPLILNAREGHLIQEFAKVMNMKNKLFHSDYGFIGTSNKLIDKLGIDYFKNKFKINIKKMSKAEFFRQLEDEEEIPLPKEEQILSLFIDHDEELSTLRKAYRILLRFLEENKLKGLAINIFDINFQAEVISSLLSEKGYSIVVDDDIYGLISVSILNLLAGSSALYGMIYQIDLEGGKLSLLVNNAPINMLSASKTLSKGNITLYKMSFDHKRMVVTTGKIVESNYVDRNMVKCDIEVDDRELFTLYNETVGGTLAFTYGDFVGNILAFNNILRLEEEEDK